jgi:hypothetical protein
MTSSLDGGGDAGGLYGEAGEGQQEEQGREE